MSRRYHDPFVSVSGLHALDTLSLYNGDGYDDPEVVSFNRRAYSERYRRAHGAKPFVRGDSGAYNTPCKGCVFAQTCKEKELACNIFAEWSVSRRPIPPGIKQLLPSKKWMRLLSETEHLGPVRAAYYAVIEKQAGVAPPQTDDLFFDAR